MSRSRAATIAFLAGLAVMVLELCAVRLEAPHFGDSAYVWTNVIGVILVALAGGAVLGGRLADRGAPPRSLGLVLVGAAALTALAPFLARAVGGWLVPQELPLEAAMPALVRGSLVATLLLFAPPVFLLGSVSPWLVSLTSRASVGGVGRAAGAISAAATLGSLVGTFAATHFAIPHFGSRTTVLACAAILAIAGALALGRATPAALGAVALAASTILPVPARPAGPNETLLAETESAYQFLQVVRTQDGAVPVTALKINEGLDSFHSLARADGPFTGGAYYDYHVVTPWLARAGTARRGPVHVLSLGSACGTFDRLFAAVHQGCKVDEVEIDAAVSALGDAHFGGKTSAGRRYDGLDARVFANRAAGSYDVVLVDAYARQIYVPAHVVSIEFFAAAARLLDEGGVVSVNLGGTSFDDPVVATVGRTLARVFGSAGALRIPASRNFLLVARKGLPLDREMLARVTDADPRCAPALLAWQKDGSWRAWRDDPAAGVLVDGWPLLDVLQDEVLRKRAERTTLLPAVPGGRGVAELESQVAAALTSGAFEEAKALLGTAGSWSAYLRYLAGDVRWQLHDPEGARLEYEEARRLDAKVVPAETLDTRIRGATELAAPLVHAASVGSRNGWLALAVGSALVGLCGWLVARQKMSSTPATWS